MDVAGDVAVHHRTMRRWVVVVLAGVAALAVGGVMLAVGLDTADKVGSVVGAVCGVVGLGVSTYGLVVVRSAGQQTAPETQASVTNSVHGSNVTGNTTQVDSVGRDLVTGGTNISGANPVVAGPGGTAIGRVESMVLPASAVATEPLPPPTVELCIGRAEQIHAVSRAWETGHWAVVTGGPGIGKSTLLGRAIGLDAIVMAFRDRRFVVSCDGAGTAGVVIDKLATVLGVGLGEHLRNRVVSFLGTAPCVLVLDNFETVTDADPAGAAELLSTLRAVPGLVTGIGSRGAHVPTGLVGLREINLRPLPQDDAIDVFVAVAGERHRADPAIRALMADLDGVPLAIVLMASLARTESHLGTLATAWRAKRTDLLQHGANPDRTSSLPVSIELSWDQLSLDGRAALSLAALLPDGWPHNKAGMYLPEELAAGVIELSRRALLHDDELRQRCLAPLRQHVLARHPPDSAQIGLLAAPVRMLTARAAQVGSAEGAEAATDIASELTNLVEIIRTGLPSAPTLGDAVPDLLHFQRFTGLGDDQIGLDALDSAIPVASRARNTTALARLYFSRSNNEQARALFNQAFPLYRQVGDVLGEANCLNSLGELALRESNNEQARTQFDQAFPLYQQVGDVLGEANCLHSLGELALRESNNEQARTLLNQALPLYQQVGNVLGEANCLRSLGQLAFIQSNNEQARTLFNQAFPLYQQVGDVLGEANCLNSLGELALRESNNEQARTLLNQALPLYQHTGNALGQANCLRSLGELAFIQSNNEQARTLFNQALPVYQHISAALGQANCLHSLGQLALRESNNEQARTLFNQALPLYQHTGNALGQANCLHSLGQLAFIQSNNEQARTLFNQALPLYQHISAALGQANCLRNLGELALRESNNEQARTLFNQALPLYQHTGNALGQANCLRNLGELALRESNNEQARTQFNQALPLYQHIQDRYSAAITHAWLARVTDNERHVEHLSQMDRLATELALPGFHESLRAIAER